MDKGNKQLNNLKEYFPNTECNKIKDSETINNKFEKTFSFVAANKKLDGYYFVLNLFSIHSKLINKKNLFICLDKTIDLKRFFRGIYIDNIYKTEIENLFILNKQMSKQEIYNFLEYTEKQYKFDNIIFYSNFENNFIDVFSLCNKNFLLTDLYSDSIIKLDKILKVIKQYKEINFGIFFIEIDENNTTNNDVKFISNNLMLYHKNLFLVSISFKNKILDISKKRYTLPFKNLNQINESIIFQEYKNIFFKFKDFIKEKKTWLKKQKKKSN